jgi:hypothetical protein
LTPRTEIQCKLHQCQDGWPTVQLATHHPAMLVLPAPGLVRVQPASGRPTVIVRMSQSFETSMRVLSITSEPVRALRAGRRDETDISEPSGFADGKRLTIADIWIPRSRKCSTKIKMCRYQDQDVQIPRSRKCSTKIEKLQQDVQCSLPSSTWTRYRAGGLNASGYQRATLVETSSGHDLVCIS